MKAECYNNKGEQSPFFFKFKPIIMTTETTTIVLSEENKTKVSLIEDINKINLLLTEKPLTTEEFNDLYDYTIRELEGIITTGVIAVEFVKNIELLKKLITKDTEKYIKDRGLEDGN